MRLTGRRPRREAGAPQLVEVVTPRTNAATLTPAENLLAALALAEPFALEIAATGESRRFLARAGGPAMLRLLGDQLGVAYPQAELRRLDAARDPEGDPARRRPGELVGACALGLRGPAYLPLRTFADVQVDDERSSQADPILGVLGALGDLPEGWRALTQLVLRPAPDDWCQPYLRLALENPVAAERVGGAERPSLAPVFGLLALIGAAALARQAYGWYEDHLWLNLALLGTGVTAAAPAAFLLARRLGRRPLQDPRLVQEKIGRLAYLAQLRLAVFAPADTPPEQVRARLARLAAAYRQYGLATGNGFVARRLRLRGRDLAEPDFLPCAGATPVLNVRELAGLWHLPQQGADVPRLERTGARRWLPLPSTVARGCPIGVSRGQGDEVPIALPDDLLRRHLLMVAKTRRGKSSLLLRIARHLIDVGVGDGRRAVVLVDPHRDLAENVLGCMPAHRRGDVVYLDVGNRERPFGLNLVDVGLGWDRDKAVDNVIDIFRREWDQFWGPRMEDAFRHALMTLYEANQARCAGPGGRMAQLTLLDVPALFTETGFRRRVIETTTDPVIREWWRRFDRFELKQQLDIIYPVQTKVQRYVGSMAARGIVGQPCSTIDPAAWLRDGSVVVVNVGKGVVGQDTAALLGGTLLNLVALVVGEQARLPAGARRPVSVLVDEFHVMPGADYETFLSELPKYGASLVLATQSLGRIEALDRAHGRALRATLFANLDGLFAFHVSAEDAEYLVRELGGGVDEQDLVALGEHRCYARLSTGGARPPAFSVELNRPPRGDRALVRVLAARSAARYGRDPAKVAEARRAALEPLAPAQAQSPSPAPASGAATEPAPAAQVGGRRRRPRRPPRAGGQVAEAVLQTALFEADDAPDDGAESSETGGEPPDREPTA